MIKKFFQDKYSQIVILLSLIIFSFFAISPVHSFAQGEVVSEVMEGKIIEIPESGQERVFDQLVDYQLLKIKLTKGSSQDEEIEVRNTQLMGGVYQQYQLDDHIRIIASQTPDGSEYFLDGHVKRTGLILLVVLFVASVIIVGKVWGALSLLGLAISFLVIFKVIIPQIINGTDPIVAAILGASLIIPSTFYISHGFNKKTHVGVAATLISLILTGVLAVIFVDLLHLTGFASEEAGFLQVERQGSINIRGLLLAGIIIGTLGILDDVTIGQSSTVEQLKKVSPELSIKELFQKGMKVGQDHISSMVNTLVLVYSGSALPLLLLFFDSNKTFLEMMEFELIAEEILRMLVGSIGLVFAAPLATIMAAYLFNLQNRNTKISKKVA